MIKCGGFFFVIYLKISSFWWTNIKISFFFGDKTSHLMSRCKKVIYHVDKKKQQHWWSKGDKICDTKEMISFSIFTQMTLTCVWQTIQFLTTTRVVFSKLSEVVLLLCTVYIKSLGKRNCFLQIIKFHHITMPFQEFSCENVIKLLRTASGSTSHNIVLNIHYHLKRNTLFW